jgi:hypothetical protein
VSRVDSISRAGEGRVPSYLQPSREGQWPVGAIVQVASHPTGRGADGWSSTGGDRKPPAGARAANQRG